MIWLGVAVILIAAGAMVGRSIVRAKTNLTPIAAYLVPIDNTSRVKPAWWHTVRLSLPRPLRSGERLTLPAGSSLTLIRADSGAAESVAGPTELFLQQKLPAEPDILASPLPEIIGAIKAPAPAENALTVTSPVGMTRYLNPLITWTAREGLTYDVAMADSADPLVPPRTARGVRPPIALADLATPQRRQLGVDRNYIVIVREANSPTTTAGARLLTTTDAQLQNQLPSTPAELIAEAVAALAKKPYRTGDAWLALSRLPPDWARSELAVRLRLRVAAELGLADELNRALADARALKTG
jgi:hypothetical protein